MVDGIIQKLPCVYAHTASVDETSWPSFSIRELASQGLVVVEIFEA